MTRRKARGRFGSIVTSDGDVILPLASPGAASIFLKTAMPAKCCDGRMVMIIVNRGGKTRCIDCDGKYQTEEAVP